MDLTVADRIKLLSILPAEGDVFTLKIIRDLRGELSFSEDEHRQTGLTQSGDRVSWNEPDTLVKDVTIGPVAHKVITEALHRLSASQRLRIELLDSYERFVGDPD